MFVLFVMLFCCAVNCVCEFDEGNSYWDFDMFVRAVYLSFVMGACELFVGVIKMFK
jgi:hypothetical protein